MIVSFRFLLYNTYFGSSSTGKWNSLKINIRQDENVLEFYVFFLFENILYNLRRRGRLKYNSSD